MNHPILRSAALATITGLATLSLAGAALAQPPQMQLPRPSPGASVSQTVGVTEITVRYSRPGVKERKIWGGLVPYGEVWRTGANENTTITFSTPVRLGGTELPAGTYGLQTIPTEKEWTVILSKDADLWGAFDYKPEHDALRLQATPRPAEFQERMGFSFEDVTDTSAKVVLRWEKIAVPFTVEVDTPKLALANVQQVVRWQTPLQAANYCIQNDTCLDEAGRWLNASIALEEAFGNYRAKALLLAKKSDWKGAVAAGDKALALAKTAQQPPPAAQVADLEKSLAEWRKK
jgi:Protein of unknown function (DUF2911)